MALHVIQLPETLFERLKQQAHAEKQSVDEWARRVLVQQLKPAVPVEDELPLVLKNELNAMERLSDSALWQLAQCRMSERDLARWDALRDARQERELTDTERDEIAHFLHEYDETTLRRSHAAMLLHSRGHAVP